MAIGVYRIDIGRLDSFGFADLGGILADPFAEEVELCPANETSFFDFDFVDDGSV